MRQSRAPRLGLQTKVLIPVLAFMVLLPAITVWIVSGRISDQMQLESRATLTTARTVFEKLLEIREAELQNRYRNQVADANFRGLTALRDRPTMNLFLADMLEKFSEDEIAALLDDGGRLFSWARKVPGVSAQELTDAASLLVAPALLGETDTGFVTVNDRVFLVAAVPVSISGKGPPEWVLLIANRLGDEAVQEFKSLTNTEIVLFSRGDRIAAATTKDSEGHSALIEDSAGTAPTAGVGAERIAAHPLLLNGEHFLVQPGRYGRGEGGDGFGYLLLLSNEARYRALADTRRTLVLFSAVGILLSALVVAGLVRRTFNPLRDLAEAAEAVGRGDFSRTLARVSNDECGDLASAFNRMTANLASSRAELEKTVATLRTAQQQLVQSERLSAVGQFVAGVAHELNNPLTAVIGFSELIAQLSKDTEMRPHLEMIAKSANRCHKIVESLLSFSRQHPPERKLVQINSVIEEVVQIMAYDLRTSNIKLEREFTADLPEIMADPHQLQQVFVNIMSNARQAMLTFRQDGRLVLTTEKSSGFLRVSIQDNGPGIPPENMDRIFDPFFTTKPVGKGTGLGLSLSYGIISEHGGRIYAESEAGKGTTFIIELPLVTEGLRPSSQEQAPMKERNVSGAGKSVLVVDDEEWILELARAVLQDEGYRVVTVSSGERAIGQLAQDDFDVIVTDWKMPGMNGIQFYERLLSEKPAMARRVLFMSGDVINEVFEDFLQRHKRKCLPKPFRNAKFCEAVAEIWQG